MNTKVKTEASILFTIIILMIFLLIRAFIVHRYDYEIKLIGEDTVSIIVGEEYTDKGYAITPERLDLSGYVTTVTNLNNKKPGDYKYIYKVNYNNQIKEVTRNIKVLDVTSPVITLDKKEIDILKNKEFTYPKYTAIDDVDGDISNKVKITSNVNIKKSGDYKIEYKVEDSSNNIVIEEVIVHVHDTKESYIDVSIKNQKLTYYEFKKPVLTSDIVTGINNRTPKGTYTVIEKARNVTLKGPDYSSFVSYWIDFKDHEYGFHDASWRSKFGGKIYKTNGSHGCVNMPKDKVKKLYNLVSVGTKVYIHN